MSTYTLVCILRTMYLRSQSILLEVFNNIRCSFCITLKKYCIVTGVIENDVIEDTPLVRMREREKKKARGRERERKIYIYIYIYKE